MFYKMEVQTFKSGQTAAVPVGIYEDGSQAEIAFHNAVGANMSSDQLSSFLVMIITETGYVNPSLVRYYSFVEPSPEPEPDPEPSAE